MNLRKNQAFWTSVILHLVVLFALILGVIIEAFKPREKEHVFVMVDPPSESVSPPVNSSQPAVEPQPAPPPELELPDIPDLTPIPEPAPPEPVRPAPTPTPTPTPVKPQEPELMSLDKFREKNPLKRPKPRQNSTPKPPPEIHIDPGKIDIPDTYIPSPSNSNMSQREIDAMRRYVGQISAMLNRAWVKPGSLAGRDLKVVAVFYVDASGRISNIRFRPDSGNAAFDTSVKSAFAKIRTAGPTPNGKGQEVRISFNMLD